MINGPSLLYAGLTRPATLEDRTTAEWNAIIRAARAEWLLATLGARTADLAIPPKARLLLDEAIATADINQDIARYEVRRMVEALAPLDIPILLMKGSAYLMAGLAPLPGRNIGDLDIMVQERRLQEVETALKAAGWESVKANGTYDDSYYREWMHELPPLKHPRRGGVIDLHHTILPRTARLTPKPELMFENAVPLDCGAQVMGPAEMLLHSATHLAYDGDFDGGARNLWDIDRLVRQFAEDADFWDDVEAAAAAHELTGPLRRALRLANSLYDTPSPQRLRGKMDMIDRLALKKLYGRDRFGLQRTPVTDFLLFVRGHWLRMPPFMLIRHLLTKWRARRAEARQEARQSGR